MSYYLEAPKSDAVKLAWSWAVKLKNLGIRSKTISILEAMIRTAMPSMSILTAVVFIASLFSLLSSVVQSVPCVCRVYRVQAT